MDMRFGQDEKEKPVRRICTGAAANSPKACAAFCSCRRDVREAVPYERDRHPSLYKGGAFVLPCEGGAGDRKSVGRPYGGGRNRRRDEHCSSALTSLKPKTEKCIRENLRFPGCIFHR